VLLNKVTNMKLIYKIARWIAYQCLNYAYKYLDSNQDGAVDKEEVAKALEEIKSFLSKYSKPQV